MQKVEGSNPFSRSSDPPANRAPANGRLRADRLAPGLAAWIGEKLDTWTDPRTPIAEDRILDTLMLYWLPRAAASSARLYWESVGDVTRWIEGPLKPGDRVDAPTGCTIFPHELQRPTRDEAAARFTDIRHWGEPEQGGHFPALEQPGMFATEVAAFFTRIRYQANSHAGLRQVASGRADRTADPDGSDLQSRSGMERPAGFCYRHA